MPSNTQWIEGHLKYLHGLRSLSQQQQRFIELATLDKRTVLEEKQFKSTLKLEKLTQQLVNAKAESAKLKNAAKKEERKARDHELYNSAGLMILAGTIDTVSGHAIPDKGEFVGAMMAFMQVPPNDQRRAEWKKAGDQQIALGSSPTSKKS